MKDRYFTLLQRRNDLACEIAEIEAELAQMDKSILNSIAMGTPVDGFALKKGRQTRVFKDHDNVIYLLKGSFPAQNWYETKPLPLTKIESQLKAIGISKEDIAQFLEPHLTVKVSDPTVIFKG